MVSIFSSNNEVIPDLFVGGKPHEIVGFKYVFNFAGSPRYFIPDGTIVTTWLFDDIDEIPNESNLLEIVQAVNQASKKGKTLVHCSAGLNRSCFVVALSLMMDGMTADDAIKLLRVKRSEEALFNTTFVQYLQNWQPKQS